MRRTGSFRRRDEVALKQGADVWGEDAIEKNGELVTERRSVRNHADHGGGDNERREERDDRGVGGGLREVETIVPYRAQQCSM